MPQFAGVGFSCVTLNLEIQLVLAAPLPVDTSANAMQLAETIFGKGVTLVSAAYQGDPLSSGIFTDGNHISPGVTPAESGIILSTGHASAFTNSSGEANQRSDQSVDTSGIDADPRLTEVAGVQTFDGAILEATFVPQGSTLTMQLVFSSEEYPEYVNGGFNDAVVIYVNGVRATLTIGSGNISIDNITDGGDNGSPSNENLYIDNRNSDYNTEMDGFTVTLTLKAPVNPGVPNTIWFGIADAGDSGYDSNLLIAADSVQTEVIAFDDSVTMGRGKTEILNILGNDTAGPTSTLTVTQINGQNVSPGDSVTLTSGTIVTLNPDGTLTIDSSGSLGEESISYQISDGDGTTDVGFIKIDITCFAKGTMIQTDYGYVAIEDLTINSAVATKDNGLQPIRWLGSRMLDAETLAQNRNLHPIRIRANAIGAGIPFRDLLVSPQHRILVRSKIAQRMFGADEVLVAAKQLLQIEGIEIATDVAEVEYFHMLFDRHEVVISNGAETESLYTGAEALKAIGPTARNEIFALFPELSSKDYEPSSARPLLSGSETRRLAARHQKNSRSLFM
ncbi:Hint domain-containing protein [Paracoccus cavernae]|uniref:Hint domain-containing protein n=1 Tax=Paracoccus cavernae TaxID=1571207 RepID=A0ABT8D3Q4_9RHOB|nr:Hint domain-containing protein [Paracoccus cavernae]